MNALDVAVARVAARQRSLVHRDQARALGMTLRQYQARTKSGLYVRAQPNVVRLAGAPVTWEQRVLAACLSSGDGTAASHRAAALIWGLRGIEQAPLEITVPAGRRPTLHDVVVHTSKVGGFTTRRGIPVTSPAATVFGLAAVVDLATLESAAEDAILRRLTTFALLADMVERFGRPGRDGVVALRRVLEERGPAAAATESVLEDGMVQLLRRAGMGEFERQYWVGGYRLDFAKPAAKLGIEVNGAAFHSSGRRPAAQLPEAQPAARPRLAGVAVHVDRYPVPARPRARRARRRGGLTMARSRVGVVLLVPAPVDREIDALRRAVGDGTYGRVPAHLTLVPPVNVRDDRFDDALALLRQAAAATRPFTVELGPPTTFLPNNPVLYLPVQSGVKEVVATRDRVFRDPFARPLTWPFVPHVTVADEMSPERIVAAQEALSHYHVDIAFDRMHLLEEGPGRVWGPIADFAFGPAAVIGRGGIPVELTVTDQTDPSADGFLRDRRQPVTITARRDGLVVGVARGWADGQAAQIIEMVVADGERDLGTDNHLTAAFDSWAAKRGVWRHAGDG